jgi:hypothetical protein
MNNSRHSLLLLLITFATHSSVYEPRFSLESCSATFYSIRDNVSDSTPLLDYNGRSAESRENAVGFSFETCIQVCGEGYDLNNYSAAIQDMSVWFLPYTTLIAQVPLQTSSLWSDFWVIILTIGSPMLALYSLFVSYFNRRWLDKKIVTLVKDLQVDFDGPAAGRREIIETFHQVLRRMQHYPITIQNRRLLASAIVLDENREMWRQLYHGFRATDKHLDGPAAVQLAFFVLIYILSIILALGSIGGMTLSSRF